MHTAVYLLLLASVVLAVAGPRLTRGLAPATAARALTALILTAAAASTTGLIVLAVGGLSRTDEVLAFSHPDTAVLAADDPVPRRIGALAAVLILIVLVRLVVAVVRRVRSVRALAVVRRSPAAGDLIVVEAEEATAFALPGRPRRIVVSTGMLRALPAAERTVLLAHERAHLAHGHHRLQALAEAAAAVNPLLGGVREHLAFALERWADEEAATAVASRTLAARSLARAALASTSRASGPATALGYLHHRVAARVAALQGTRPVNRVSATLPAVVLTVLTAFALVDTDAALLRCLQALHP
ncbi:M48 family metalloprotease [Streptomyces silvisoli]|uniref:M48 family metalloprotease n=1 Tax=Streptomyces silvisoli TaxID=3034235 RepID=A0ABT5ZPQ7_9ACTN|nr:M48 family metalloprotease [Streptomyces silvisoli]MDF3291565.1 M48 family metalloprotease [Streptomyces silvisoli]